MGDNGSGMEFLPHISQVAFQLQDQLKVDLLASSGTSQCQHYYILENHLCLRALGLNAFNHQWLFQVIDEFSFTA